MPSRYLSKDIYALRSRKFGGSRWKSRMTRGFDHQAWAKMRCQHLATYPNEPRLWISRPSHACSPRPMSRTPRGTSEQPGALMTLCADCHEETSTYTGRAIPAGPKPSRGNRLNPPRWHFSFSGDETKDRFSEVLRLERFADEAIGPALVCPAAGLLFGVSGQHHYRQV